MRTLPFPGTTPYQRNIILWEPQGTPKAVILISHGMAEHIARYDALGQYLAKEGFLTAGYNHLGHGEEAPVLGFFAPEDGWGKVVADLKTVMDYISSLAPGRKRILLGHSMGSFLAREYILRYPQGVDALILSGSGWHPKLLCVFGKGLAKIPLALRKGDKPSKFLDSLAFSSNNKPFKAPGVSTCAWLSRDKAQVKKYEDDPFCGYTFTASGFYDLFSGLKELTKLDRFERISKDMPVYFMSGKSDPVGKMGEGIKILEGQYRSAGLKNITVKLYDGARHELFNEINRDEVIKDMTDWILHHI